MTFRAFIFFIPFIACCHYVTGQVNQQVTIIADISGYPGKLPVSNHPIWEGNDTLVPLTANYKVPETMGAEYIVFPYRLDGDSISPYNDAVRSARLKLWRTKATITNKLYTWFFEINKPCIVSNSSLLGGGYLVLPGDSIYITYDKGNHVFFGRGAARFQILYEMNKIKESFYLLKEKRWPKDIMQFIEINSYLNEQSGKALAILESDKAKLSQYEYDWIKARFLGITEYNRWLYFYMTPNPAVKKTESFSYTSRDHVRVWDSTMYRPDAIWYRSATVQNLPGIGNRGYIESFIVTELHRNLDFLAVDSIKNQQVFKKLAYHKIKSSFTGLFRERLLCYFINEEFIQEMGSHGWFAQSILKDYYNTPGFPAYKKWVKQMENDHLYLSRAENGGAPLFTLKDRQKHSYSKKNTEGKFTIVNFWYSGCKPCKQTSKDLSELQKRYEKDTNIVFLHVSTDSERGKWINSIKEGKYVPRSGVHLYTGGTGREHEMLKDYDVTSFPTIRMYDHNGRIVLDEANPFATTFSKKHLLALTGSQLPRFQDGPYVFFEGGETKAFMINDKKAERIDPTINFTSSSDQFDQSFSFSLQKQLTVPAAVYPAPPKILVLSDIEGNFTPLRKLLQASKVIDEHFNWTFGQGHLVFAGDMFDRGEQVTECLWLIYSLEEKARAAGGMVHFILGNHEIMNLQGNHRYVEDKYKNSATLMGKTLTELYNKDSELGQWLRTKNIVEKIGDMLFLHGGISSELNQTPVTLEDINQLARPHFDERKEDYGDAKVNTIMSSLAGPFWFRGYYGTKPIMTVVDSTLQKFDVKHIVTGHTIVADTISVHYEGKVINTDTRHAGGQSEALLVEGGHFYRLCTAGNRILLFKERSHFLNRLSSRAD